MTNFVYALSQVASKHENPQPIAAFAIRSDADAFAALALVRYSSEYRVIQIAAGQIVLSQIAARKG